MDRKLPNNEEWLDDADLGLSELVSDMGGDGSMRLERRQANTFSATILDTVGALVVVTDPQGMITYFNSTCVAVTGYGIGEARGKRIWELLWLPEDSDRIRSNFERLLAGEFPIKFESYWLTKAQGHRLIAWTFTADCDGAGLVQQIICTGIDVTQQSQFRKSLSHHVEERTTELSSLLSVSYKVASTLELPQLLEIILDELKGVVNYTAATIFQVDGNDLAVLAHRGPFPPQKQFRFKQAAGKLVNKDVFLKGDTLFVPDVRASSPLVQAFRNIGGDHNGIFNFVRSAMAVPLVSKGKILGILTLGHSKQNHYVLAQANLVRAFANQVAVSIENARLYAEVKIRAELAQTLVEVQKRVNSSQQHGNILQMIVTEARRLTDSDSSAIYILDGDFVELSAASGDVDFEARELRMPAQKSAKGQSLTAGTYVAADSATASRKQTAETSQKAVVRRFLAAPLLIGDTAVGTLMLVCSGSMKFGSEQEQLLTMLASSAALVIEYARLNRRLDSRIE